MTEGFTESVIREMTRIAAENDAINLAQGFPDFPAPSLIKEAAMKAIHDDINQYAITWGAASLRIEVARALEAGYGGEIDPDREVTVTCGATEAMAAVMMALLNPGDEIIVLEPFYENYGPDAALAGATARFFTLKPPAYRLDLDALADFITPQTKALVINSPNNPSGRVFDDTELEGIAALCRARDLVAITDEIYEHIIYEGRHRSLGGLPGMRERTITINGASKTFSVTGWRVGTIVAPPEITDAIRKVHDFLTVGAPAPLQEACAIAMRDLGQDYYDGLAGGYRRRRDLFVPGLEAAGFRCTKPQGAYYVLADFSGLSDEDSSTFARRLVREAGVAAVPGSSFFREDGMGDNLLRFVFCKRTSTLEAAVDRLIAFAEAGSASAS